MLLKQVDELCQKDVQSDSIVQKNNELKGQLSFVQQQYEKVANELETLKCSNKDIDDRFQSINRQLEQSRHELDKQKLEHSNEIDRINKTFFGM